MSTTTVDSLVLDLLAWVGTRDRTYQEVMEAWRTSCPKLPVWEEANERGLLVEDSSSIIRLSVAGHRLLDGKGQ